MEDLQAQPSTPYARDETDGASIWHSYKPGFISNMVKLGKFKLGKFKPTGSCIIYFLTQRYCLDFSKCTTGQETPRFDGLDNTPLMRYELPQGLLIAARRGIMEAGFNKVGDEIPCRIAASTHTASSTECADGFG